MFLSLSDNNQMGNATLQVSSTYIQQNDCYQLKIALYWLYFSSFYSIINNDEVEHDGKNYQGQGLYYMCLREIFMYLFSVVVCFR